MNALDYARHLKRKTAPLALLALLSLTLNTAAHAQQAPRPAKAGAVQPPLELAEQMPNCPGGYDKLLDDLRAAVKLPAGVRNGGRWFVHFTVGADGRLGSTSVQPSPRNKMSETSADGKALAQALRAALRLVLADAEWTPAQQGGKPVALAVTLPVLLP